MHVGGVRTALFAWLYARKHDGQFIFRVEDTDKAREMDGSIPHMIECLKWLGLDWDEGIDIGGPCAPYLQSGRLDSYKKYALELIEKGYAYPDPYTSEELEAFRAQAEAEKRPFLFRDHRPETFDAWDGSKPLRFRVPEVKRYAWNDLVRGELSAGEEALDDFILIKADGYPTYNFAHVIDDLLMGITHIMRGEEFISSTPKFLSLYEALGITPPAMATMPVILGPDGTKKLSKRDGAKDLLEYKTEGYLPHAMMNFLALLGWHPAGDAELLTQDELIAAFEISHVQKGGAKLDEEKLKFINQHWMRQLSDESFIAEGGLEASDNAMLKKAVPLLKERARTFGEAKALLAGELSCLFTAPELSVETLLAKEPADAPGFAKAALERLLVPLESLQDGLSADEAKEALMPLADKLEAERKGGRGGMLWPLRYALSGLERSPDPFTLISLVGPAESASRVRAAIAIL
jgi:glutamyl-tRNA synthetase